MLKMVQSLATSHYNSDHLTRHWCRDFVVGGRGKEVHDREPRVSGFEPGAARL